MLDLQPTYLGDCTIDEVESLALMHGLETDSLQAFNWVTGRQEMESSCGNVVSECQSWLKRDWTVTINQIFKEGNRVADEIARLVLRLQHGEVMRWNTLPES